LDLVGWMVYDMPEKGNLWKHQKVSLEPLETPEYLADFTQSTNIWGLASYKDFGQVGAMFYL